MGAEVISFLKLWLVLPASVIFTVVYAKLSNIFNFERVFYIVVTTFLCFFLIFAYVIYPNQLLYHPDAHFVNALSSSYPNFKWFAIIVGKWSYAIMYIISELWSVVVVNLMFWQFANHIFNTEQAKRFYPILATIGNMGLIFAGNILILFSGRISIGDEFALHDESMQCQQMLKSVIAAIIFCGVISMILLKRVNNIIILRNKQNRTIHHEQNKTKLSLVESIKLVIHSGYIGRIAVLVLCYGIVINLLEGPWKAKLRECYPTTVEYANFMGQFNIYLGVTSVIFTIIASNMLRRLSWIKVALFTPIMIFCTGIIFFVFVITDPEIKIWNLTIDPLFAAVTIGALQNILSKSTKYSLFDSTKEMAYIPLSLELRTKGKATVEVIGLKFGKSLGAFVQSMIFVITPSANFNSITEHLMIVFIVFIVIWIHNIFYLNRSYIKLRDVK